jgi:DNA invertase Pin-like site-specific DNA recombinase
MRVLVAGRLSRKVADRDQTGFDSQEREAVRWAESEGHTVVDVVADFAKGPSMLWERKKLRPWVTDPERLAQYDAIVALKVDRLTRADDAGVDAIKAWARREHKQILISSAAARFPAEGTDGIIWDTMIRVARAEWLATQERYTRMHRTRKAQGSILGRAPWGYRIVKRDGVKVFEPTPEGRIWVPRIFDAAVSGMTSRQIAEMLDSAGVKPTRGGKWHEGFIVNKLLRNTTYYGKPAWSGTADALVSKTTWERAGAAMSGRARHPAAVAPKALLAPVCGHPDCDASGGRPSPMYRMYAAYKHGRVAFYRCTGKGAQRRGCGAPLVPCETLDALVLGASEYWDANEYIAYEYVAGNDVGQMVEALKAKLNDASTRKEANDIWDQIEALEAQGSVLPHWEPRHTGITEGEHLRSLDLDGQRQYLASKTIEAWKTDDGVVHVKVEGALARTPSRVIGEMIQGMP